MAGRRVFFSFHYARDHSRVNVVRNSDVTKQGIEQSGYWDHGLWEKTKQTGEKALKKLIDEGLRGTSVTVVCAGLATYERKWVLYELCKSFERGNGLVTIWINRIQNFKKQSDQRGADPLARVYFALTRDEKRVVLRRKRFFGLYFDDLMTVDASKLSLAAKNKKRGYLSDLAAQYDWKADNGFENFKVWIDAAAAAAGK